MKTHLDDCRTWKRMLEAVPSHNEAANVIDHGDTVTVVVKNLRPSYQKPPVSWFIPFRPQREVTLDIMGTTLWKFCDGKRTVEQVIDLFKDTYDLTFHEAKTCVTDYLKKLIQRGILAVRVQVP